MDTLKSQDSIVTTKVMTLNEQDIQNKQNDNNHEGSQAITNDSSICGASSKPFGLDDVLHELGHFGRFQLKTCILAAFPFIAAAFMTEYVFSAASIPHRCQIPECGEYSKSSGFNPPWIGNAMQQNSSGLSSCERFAPLDLIVSNGSLNYCPASLFNNSSTIQCEAFVYARNNSVVYDFNIGCQEWRRVLVGWTGSVGELLGTPLMGLVSDRCGRRVALLICVFNFAFFGFLKAFSVNYAMYVTFQFLQYGIGAGKLITASIIATELVGPKHRVLINCIFGTIISFGGCLLGTTAWLVSSWRTMVLTLYTPCFFMLLYYWYMPESVRWLLIKRKYDEARKILEKMAVVNKTNLSKKSFDLLIAAPLIQTSKGTGVIKTILSSRVLLRRVCVTPLLWVSTTLVYYGLSVNSTSLSDQMHLNYILSSAVEIPGCIFAMIVLDRIGRKATLSSCFLLSAICNAAFVFVPADHSFWLLVLHLVGKLGISAVYTSLYLYTAELYPTEWRHSLMAFSSTIGRLGSMVAPLTPALMMYWKGLPSTLFSVMGVVSGLLVLTQPETLGTNLPDTLAEAEAL